MIFNVCSPFDNTLCGILATMLLLTSSFDVMASVFSVSDRFVIKLLFYPINSCCSTGLKVKLKESCYNKITLQNYEQYQESKNAIQQNLI